jgi:ribose transport system permease protein
MTMIKNREPRARTASSTSASKAASRRALHYGESLGLLALFALVSIFFSVYSKTSSTFPTSANLDNLLSSQVGQTIIALAVLIPLVAGYFDLSVGATAGLASIANAAAMSRHDIPLVWAILIGIAVGALVGLVNAVLVARVGINSIIVTLGTTTVISGIVQWYTDGLPINANIAPSLLNFGSQKWIGLPRPVFLLIVVLLVLWYVLEQTPFGRYLRFIGANPRSSQLVGLKVQRLAFSSFIISGATAGVAGVALTATTGGANPQSGPSYLFPALAAVYLGSTAFRPGRFNLWGTLLGVFFVAVAVSGLSLAGADPWVQPVFNGVALLVAVALSTLIRRQRTRPVT